MPPTSDLLSKQQYKKLLTDLRGIIGEGRQEAERAAGRRFVREQLAVARTVVVNTRKYDIHRRYVAHVFYAFNNRGIESTFLKGRYLNQELIDKRFAKPV